MNHVWSYSSLESFEQCPKKFMHRYILKEKEPETPALLEGQRVHAALEARIKGTPLPECYLKYSPMAESIVNAYQKGLKVYTELKMGLRKDFTPCGFFDKDVWGRSAADVILKSGNTAIIFDWKTGKKREKEMQILILALFIFSHFPSIDFITGCNLWLEWGDVGTPYKFNRDEMPVLWRTVITKIQALEKALRDNQWREQPSGLCGYCPVKPCQFNRS